jgi:hypothetical protein
MSLKDLITENMTVTEIKSLYPDTVVTDYLSIQILVFGAFVVGVMSYVIGERVAEYVKAKRGTK